MNQNINGFTNHPTCTDQVYEICLVEVTVFSILKEKRGIFEEEVIQLNITVGTDPEF